MKNRPLIAYAFLAECAGQSRDLVGGLVALVKPLIRDKAGAQFEPSELSAQLSDFYGIKIHPWAIEDMAERLEKAGLLTRVSLTAPLHNYYYAEVVDEIPNFPEDMVREVVDAFVAYSRKILERLHREIDEANLVQNFLDQLTELDFIASILKPDRKEPEPLNDNILRLRGKQREHEDYENEMSQRA